MLGESERREIEAEFPHYPYRRAVCIDALKVVQRHRGWISDEALVDIAEFLGMPFDELDSVASFYNQIFRRPVGRHVIQLCDSISCWLLGFESIRDSLIAHLGIDFGETTEDGRFTLIPIVCLGVCEKAPAMLIDSDVHAELRPSSIDQVLGSYA